MKKILEILNLYKNYTTAIGAIPIIKNLSMTLDVSEIVAIKAPSGAGKSTLLNVIGGLEEINEGRILFNDIDISTYSENELALYRNRDLGFIFQDHNLFPQCSVIENILLPTVPRMVHKNQSDCKKFAEELIEEIGLSDRKNHLPSQLSGGECQRVALARALINTPSLLLADEPTGSLDDENTISLIKLLKKINKLHKTSIIIVTHSDMVAEIADKQYSLNKGALL